MTKLLIGGLGYVGRHLTRALKDSEWVILDERAGAYADRCPLNVKIIEEKRWDGASIERAIAAYRPSSLLVLGDVGLGLSESEELARAVRVVNRKAKPTFQTSIILTSSAYVYDGPIGTAVTETSALRPRSPYSTHKLDVELALTKSCSDEGVPLGILRLFNVGGGDSDLIGDGLALPPKKLNLFGRFRAAAESRSTLFLNCVSRNGEPISYYRDFVHVYDVCDAIDALGEAMDNAGQPQMTLNCGSGQTISLIQLAMVAQSLRGFEVEVREAAQTEPLYLCADLTNMSRELNWLPKRSDIRNILREEMLE